MPIRELNTIPKLQKYNGKIRGLLISSIAILIDKEPKGADNRFIIERMGIIRMNMNEMRNFFNENISKNAFLITTNNFIFGTLIFIWNPSLDL